MDCTFYIIWEGHFSITPPPGGRWRQWFKTWGQLFWITMVRNRTGIRTNILLLHFSFTNKSVSFGFSQVYADAVVWNKQNIRTRTYMKNGKTTNRLGSRIHLHKRNEEENLCKHNVSFTCILLTFQKNLQTRREESMKIIIQWDLHCNKSLSTQLGLPKLSHKMHTVIQRPFIITAARVVWKEQQSFQKSSRKLKSTKKRKK